MNAPVRTFAFAAVSMLPAAGVCDAGNYRVERQADGTVILRMTGGLCIGGGTHPGNGFRDRARMEGFDLRCLLYKNKARRRFNQTSSRLRGCGAELQSRSGAPRGK